MRAQARALRGGRFQVDQAPAAMRSNRVVRLLAHRFTYLSCLLFARLPICPSIPHNEIARFERLDKLAEALFAGFARGFQHEFGVQRFLVWVVDAGEMLGFGAER